MGKIGKLKRDIIKNPKKIFTKRFLYSDNTATQRIAKKFLAEVGLTDSGEWKISQTAMRKKYLTTSDDELLPSKNAG